MAPTVQRFGPGTLTLGTITTAGAQVKGLTVYAEIDQDDPVFVLTGDLVQDPATTTWKVKGTLLLDGVGTGTIGKLCIDNAGVSTAFTWESTATGGVSIDGDVYPYPLDMGADEYGTVMESDFEWTFVAAPTITVST